MFLHNRTRIEMLMLATPRVVLTWSVGVNLYYNWCAPQKLRAVYSKAVIPDSKDVRDKEPCQDYLDCTYTEALRLTYIPSCISWMGCPTGVPAWSEEVTSPFSSKMRGGWLLYIEQPNAGSDVKGQGEKDIATTIRWGRVWGTKKTQHRGLSRKRGSSILGGLRQENQYEGGSAKTWYL